VAWIERVEIEEGFLDGLDLKLAPGLNVVIGARGSGKTSLLELIRFAIGAPVFTERAGAMSDAQVRAVLGLGKVIVTIRESDGGTRTVSRTVSGGDAGQAIEATVLAQNEIEAVGSSASGRLHLIDRFIDRSFSADLMRLRAEIEVAGNSVDDGRSEVETLTNRVAQLPQLEDELADLVTKQNEAFERASASAEDRQHLADLQDGLQTYSLRGELATQVGGAIETLHTHLDQTITAADFPDWVDDAGQDPFASERQAFQEAIDLVQYAKLLLEPARAGVVKALEGELEERTATEAAARSLRRRLGAVDEEVTLLSNEIAKLNESIGALRGLEDRLESRHEKLEQDVSARDQLYLELDDVRHDRFTQRQKIVEALNRGLNPAIEIELVESAQLENYENEIISRLRGTGLHSKTLAPELTQAFSPSDLLRMLESDDVQAVVDSTSLNRKRVEAAFEQLRKSKPSSLATVGVDDSVELFLLDESTVKPSDELSIGQRCTAVLPLLLERHGDLLVIDQPEDHLDNAFVTSTLVESLRNRPSGDQVILSSHNANVPVLGDADRVVHLSSDGKRGFVSHAGQLEDREIVKAVTDVMEGGPEAFRLRAEFYAAYQDD